MPELPSVSGAVLYSPKYTGIISMTAFLFGYLEDMGGTWRPEYRLHTLWLPSLMLLPNWLGDFWRRAPISYSLHGPRLGHFPYHLPSNFISACGSQPIRQHALETSAIMGAYRLTFGLAVPGFVTPWQKAVGVGWVFGMAAFFCIGSFMLPVLLMWKGHGIRNSLSSSRNASTSCENTIIPGYCIVSAHSLQRSARRVVV